MNEGKEENGLPLYTKMVPNQERPGTIFIERSG